MKKVVILISGRGSNMQALLKAKLPCKVVAVISNRADAEGLKIAQGYGIPVAIVAHTEYSSREQFDTALAETIDAYQPDFVLLAGFMRILSDTFVHRYHGRLINIHPSLLPAYPGLNTHARALADGVKIHGCTVHFVTDELDHGPILIQAAVPVLADDTEQVLAARVLFEEHRIYLQALRWLCQDEVKLNANGVVELARYKQSGFALIYPGLE